MVICYEDVENAPCSLNIEPEAEYRRCFQQNIFGKAQCCLRGDKQSTKNDLDPKPVYASVASDESLRMIVAYTAGNDLDLEKVDAPNAYLFGSWDVSIIMGLLTD